VSKTQLDKKNPRTMKKNLFFTTLLFVVSLMSSLANDPFSDASRNYALPSFTQNNKGEVVIYWTEKDTENKTYLYFSTSKDEGKTFSDKQLIFADAGLGASRLARPKLLFKKDGTMVAVFTYRGTTPPPAAPKQEMEHGGDHSNHNAPAPAAPPARPKRESQIRYTESKDGGKTWSESKNVDNDTTPLTRGFFDAVVLSNDEVAVSYLKDVKGSTKHEERDLRIAITKNGVFQDEKLIDAVVCDCCNISLLVDNKNVLNVYYRDNNDDIRDIAVMKSNDNGVTFSKSEIIHNDKWEIKGCPHSGASSVATPTGALITWFSGTSENGGIRLVNQAGKLLKVLDPTAKNAQITAGATQAVWVWEKATDGISHVYYSKVAADNVLDAQEIAESVGGQNASSIVINNKAIVAYEIKQANQPIRIGIKVI
jgi:BNR repeat-like domain